MKKIIRSAVVTLFLTTLFFMQARGQSDSGKISFSRSFTSTVVTGNSGSTGVLGDVTEIGYQAKGIFLGIVESNKFVQPVAGNQQADLGLITTTGIDLRSEVGPGISLGGVFGVSALSGSLAGTTMPGFEIEADR